MKKLAANRVNSNLSGLLSSSVFCIALTLVFSIVGLAQGDRHNDYKADKTLRSNARVNPSTLAMELSIPLTVLPGRAGNSVPVVINYSSKVWEFYTVTASNDPQVPTIVEPRYSLQSAAGWSSTLNIPRIDYDQYEREMYYISDPGGSNTITPYVLGDSPQGVMLYYVKRVRVVMPGGATVEFRKDDAVHERGLSSTYTPPADKAGTFLSVDGSRMRLEMGTPNTVLYLPDGGRYIFAGSAPTPQSFIDRHGNQTALDETQTTDTLGRAPIANPIPLPLNLSQVLQTEQTAGTKTYSYPGVGAAREFKLIWGQLNTVLDAGQALKYLGDRYCTNPPTVVNNALFQSLGFLVCGGHILSNPVVLTEVRLPDGSAYRFKYNSYGEITRIDYPTGGYERFEYGYIPPVGTSGSAYSAANRGVKFRWVSEGGAGATESMWKYEAERSFSNPYSNPKYLIRTTAPDLSSTEQLLHEATQDYYSYGFSNPFVGRAYEERSFATNGALLGRKLTEWTQTGTVTVNGVTGYSEATRDLRVKREATIIFDPANTSYALATLSEIEYDTAGSSDLEQFSSLNVKKTKSYHYAVIPRATAESETLSWQTIESYFPTAKLATIGETDYLYNNGYRDRGIVGLVSDTRVIDPGTNQIKAKSQIIYDEVNYLEGITVTNAPGWTNPNTGYRALPTTTKSWNDSTNSWIETRALYDQFGNLRKSWDGRNNYSETQYTDNYSDAVNRSTYAFPTKTISYSGDNGTGTIFDSTTKYDFNTGLVRYSTDVNNQTTERQYNDALLRLTKVIAPNGQQSITEYGVPDSNGQLPANQRFVKSRTQIDESKWKEGLTWYDGLGRTIRSQSVDTVGGDVFSLTCYDTMGRMVKVTNPFRNFTNQTCSTTTGLEWNTTTYDAAGRAWKMTTPDGAEVEKTYALATTSNQIGTVVTVEEQAGKLRRSVTNALGQLKRVDEPNDSNQLGAIDSPNQYTSYDYDTLNNLITVSQGAQTRTFAYDSLSRLKEATNPESGTIKYTYDLNGNLQTKRDARGIKTIYDYDALNRVIKRCYLVIGTGSLGATACASAGSETPEPNTLDVTYTYEDTNVSYSKGKLTKVVTGNTTTPFSKTEYTEFDIMGRIKKSKQTTDGTAYNEMEYVYNLSGALVEEKYPSGRVVKNVLDNDGELSIVQSKKHANAGYWNYAQHFTYTAAGAVASMQLGNGRWESTQFNSRLQPTQIALGSTQNTTDLLKLNFDYGTTANNGNVLSQTIVVPTETRNNQTYGGFTATQTYSYDSLNRIKDAKETINSVEQWKQTFTYDRYGNRRFDQANTTAPNLQSALPKVANPEILTTNNRFKPDQDNDGINDYLYDASGNTTKDALGRTFIYDAENKQTEVKDSQNISIGIYFYDGDGKRVKKLVPSTAEITLFIYDAFGKLIMEYSTVQPQTPQVSYLTTDHLGSPRINTDKNGNVTARHDYQPFGEEVNRASYGNDEVRKQFTSYERDNETDLDFAQARMLNTSVGRFGTPDPYNVILEKERGEDEDERAEILIGFISNPQRWNMYVYVVNNPLAFTDPDGQTPRTINVFLDAGVLSPEGLKAWQEWAASAQKKDKKLTVNIYLMSKDTPGTVNAFLESLKAKDTATIFMGHSYNQIGIYLSRRSIGSSQAKSENKVSHTADGIDIQNAVVAVFSCGFGNGFDNITSSNGTAFVSIVQGQVPGAHRTTFGDATNAAASRFAQSIAEGSWDIFSLRNSLDRAVQQGQSGINAYPHPTEPLVNAGDYVNYRILPPPRKRR